jgi:alpha-aminoadipate carrier protein LysW
MIRPMTVECPECAAEVALPHDVMANELVSCADCGSELEILSLHPLAVDYAPAVEEDWGE